ncbi:MAG: PAS domain-containing protein [Coriobacteriia bacterium]
MAGTRLVVKRAPGAEGAGDMPVLERAVREVAEAMPALAVYAYALARDGAYHCVAVTPADRVRPDHLSPQRTPRAIDVIYGRSAAILDDWNESALDGERVVLIPLWDDHGPVGALVTITEAPPTEIGLRMLTVHGRALGQALTRDRELETARTRIDALTRTGEMMIESFGAMHEVVFVVDLDGRVLRWNEGCERLVGWSSADTIGAVFPGIPESRRVIALHRLREGAARREVFAMDVVIERKDGTPLCLDVHALPIFDEAANPYAVMIAHGPIAPPHNVRPAGSNSPSDLYLASLVVRELTSPLTAVTGYTQLLSRPVIAEDSERRERITRSMLARCAEIEALLEDLALLSGLQSAPSLNMEEVDLVAMVKRLLDRLDGSFADERFSADRVTGAGTALVDRMCAERSVLGLVRCLGRTCGREARVAFSVRDAGHRVSLTIETHEASDDEADALLEHLEHLEHLAQREPVTEAGLGLHLARIVAEAHGGGVSIAREARKAPSVTIDLPAAPQGGLSEEERWRTTMM